jgi:hypothetical protein
MARIFLALLSLCFLVVLLTGCPPAREDIGGNQAGSSALFLSVYYPSYQASAATVLIPREQGMTCDFDYSLADDDEDFLLLDFVRGDLHDWAGAYVANGVDDELCAVTGYYNYDLQDQRCLTGLSGINTAGSPLVLGESTRLSLSVYNEALVSGSVHHSGSQVEYFTATNCGERMQYGVPGDTAAPVPGREVPTSPWALRFR